MLKIVLDTNIVVSALIGDSHPAEILRDIVFENKVVVAISQEVCEEYFAVINREKFRRYENFVVNVQIVLQRLVDLAVNYSPIEKFHTLRDQSDNKFLDLAAAAEADYLITGNIKDFKISDIGKLKIVSPKEFSASWQQTR